MSTLQQLQQLPLREKRVLFSRLISRLILEASNDLGLKVAFDQVKRSPEEAARLAREGKGIANSVHNLGLAADLIIWKDLDGDGEEDDYAARSEEYEVLGVRWEAYNPLCRWGGRFKRVDGNHFSLEHNGVM